MPHVGGSDRSEGRTRLVDAAWRCASTTGFQTMPVDDVCNEAGVSKGAFYLYFDQKQDLLLALLEDDAAAVDSIMDDVARARSSAVERLRRLVRSMIDRGADTARLQVRADLWSAMSHSPVVQERFGEAVSRRRTVLKSWIDEGIANGEIVEIPSNAFAAILLALSDGLLLHAGLDPSSFRWPNVRRALDALLDGIRVA